MNTATTIAALFANDGSRFAHNGRFFLPEVKAADPTWWTYDCGRVAEFSDGSALAIVGDGWGIVAWDEATGAFYSVTEDGTRDPSGWTIGFND